MSDKRENRVAIVTGASSGIGIYYAQSLAQRGYNVLMVSNMERELKERAIVIAQNTEAKYIDAPSVNGSIKEQWVSALYKDLSKEESASEIFNYCLNCGLDVEVLINNAGIFIFNDLNDCPSGKIDLILKLHIYTVTMLCRLFGEKMAEKGEGYILNMSSLAAHIPFPAISLYSATKSYIRTFSIALRLELKEKGVNVLTVSPGAVATDLYSLPKKLQEFGVRIGVIFRPEKLAVRALKRLFKGKREYIPGFINRLFKPLYNITPTSAKMWLRAKTARFKK